MLIKAHGDTNVGKRRPHNEDNFCIVHNNNIFLAAVADGLGGHDHGEVASKMMVDYLGKWCISGVGKEKLESCINQCNYDMKFKLNGGGATLAMIARKSRSMSVIVINCGDSRVYLVRDKKITQITKDHSLMQQMLDNGTLKEKEIENFPHKNIITSHVGQGEKIEVSSKTIKIHDNDIFVICSDGLTNEVSDSDILDTVLKYSSKPEIAVNSLIHQANKNGGKDNITVIVASFAV